MTTLTSHLALPDIGRLCFGGDWAWAHGEFGALRDIAMRLAACTPEPMHGDLNTLADLCIYDLDGAAALWATLKDRVYQAAAS